MLGLWGSLHPPPTHTHTLCLSPGRFLSTLNPCFLGLLHSEFPAHRPYCRGAPGASHCSHAPWGPVSQGMPAPPAAAPDRLPAAVLDSSRDTLGRTDDQVLQIPFPNLRARPFSPAPRQHSGLTVTWTSGSKSVVSKQFWHILPPWPSPPSNRNHGSNFCAFLGTSDKLPT